MLDCFCQWNRNKLNRECTELCTRACVPSELTGRLLTWIGITESSATRTRVSYQRTTQVSNNWEFSSTTTNFLFFYKYIKKQKVSRTSIVMFTQSITLRSVERVSKNLIRPSQCTVISSADHSTEPTAGKCTAFFRRPQWSDKDLTMEIRGIKGIAEHSPY